MSVTVGVVFISDRDPDLYLNDCRASFDAHCADPMGMLGPVGMVNDRDHQLGMAGAVNEAWAWATDQGVDFLFHIEEDFVFRQEFSLRSMLFALSWGTKKLAQIVMKRQPWNPEEQAAGNILHTFGKIQERSMHTDALGSVQWVTHSHIFSLNPCIIPHAVFSQGYPTGNEAEATQRFLGQGYEFAIYGGIDDSPLVEHVGHVRGTGWKL